MATPYRRAGTRASWTIPALKAINIAIEEIMMAHYSVAKAKDGLSGLIAKAQAGEEVIITSHGRPVVELSTIKSGPAVSGHMTQWLLARTRSRKSVGINSVELLDMIYNENEA